MNDDELVAAMTGAKLIVARAGYSTIMDLNAFDLNQINYKY